MIERRILGFLDQYLHITFPEKRNEIFGDYSILIFGDFTQLPTIDDKSLFDL
jgi:hypothetical protein